MIGIDNGHVDFNDIQHTPNNTMEWVDDGIDEKYGISGSKDNEKMLDLLSQKLTLQEYALLEMKDDSTKVLWIGWNLLKLKILSITYLHFEIHLYTQTWTRKQ